LKFEQLADFVRNRMRMSHIYQPVMLIELLRSGGKCSIRQIAKSILAHDESQLEYYDDITNNIVGRILRRHGILQKQNRRYNLIDYASFSASQREELIKLCRQRLDEYVRRRGDRIWMHRKLSAVHISGSLKYDVLKRARFHCDLCGVSADERALEVDHIVPRNKGGTDDLDNLQCLCYRCNSMKRDMDATDLRAVRESFSARETGCPFCDFPPERVIAGNNLCFAIRDAYPVTDKHTLILPRRHATNYFELGSAEINAMNRLLVQTRAEIQASDATVEGFNIGINDGSVAGQTVSHCHIHLIPRRKGDIVNPRGGVRHIIPGRGYYDLDTE
jgi:diadenosine tetraphosphate (Ap4A) HIT family hydrolase/5-methylcytosine-specific restriction endonuclease McrA